jgi:phosphotriesterase-related protein
MDAVTRRGEDNDVDESANSSAGRAMTVLGPVRASELGVTLPHEHVLLNVAFRYGPERGARYPELWDREVTMDMLGALHRDATSCRDNLILDDPELAARELAHFRRAGGSTVADATVIGIGRDPLALRRIAREAGLNIIAGTGFYVAGSHPGFVEAADADAIADRLVGDLNDGMDDTDVRAGMIGEIGTGNPVHPREEKVLRAACRAHLRTGAPMQVHVQRPGTELPRVHRVVREEGVDARSVAMLHMDDGVAEDLRFRAADWGYYVSLDCFGVERYMDRTSEVLPRDGDRIGWVQELIGRGHVEQVLVSQDVWLKMLLKHYGGWGYDHLLVNVVPMMRRAGMSAGQIEQITVHNPARLFAYVE